MNTKHIAHVGWQAVLVALCSCLLAGPLFAQQKDYQEAHVYITAPGAPPTTAPVSPAAEVVRPMLLSDRGFQTIEPLEQPDEHVPTIIIDEKKTFQTIIGFGAAFTVAASTTFGKLPKESQEQFLKACFDPAEGNRCTFEKADMPSRAAWTAFVARQFEKRGWSWAVWQFADNFAVFDLANQKWVEPLRDALIPP